MNEFVEIGSYGVFKISEIKYVTRNKLKLTDDEEIKISLNGLEFGKVQSILLAYKGKKDED